jgi:hypothetical protein
MVGICFVGDDEKLASLEYDEVKRRVQAASAEVLEDLSALGQIILRDVTERIAKHDSKATAIAAYSGGIITLCVSTSPIWGPRLSGALPRTVIVAGVFCFLLAAWLAVRSTFPIDTEWHSDNDWLRSECLDSKETMQRYRILTMWKVNNSLETAYKKKVGQLRVVLYAVQTGFVLLVLGALLKVACRLASF